MTGAKENIYSAVTETQSTPSIIPIILSGGSGSRLWPVSRASKPKQFLKFNTRYSLIQQTALRCKTQQFDARPIIVCAQAHRFLIAQAMQEIGMKADIVLEPGPRDTCAAIAAGCLKARQRCHDGLVLVLACDHIIPEQQPFVDAIQAAIGDAFFGNLVTFATRPKSAACGYGYILPGKRLRKNGCFQVNRFVEKPGSKRAQKLVNEGYLWNSGNFLFTANAFMKELQFHNPQIFDAVGKAFDNAATDLDFLRLNKRDFLRSPAISVDYAVMTKTTRAAVYPIDYAWRDIGSWASVWQASQKTKDGNAIIGDGHIIDGNNNLVHSEDKLTALVGVDGLAVITTRDAVLVTSQDCTQNVKQLVIDLKAKGRSEANDALEIFRPWGNYERLDMGAGYQVKRLVINPGGIVSLQKHQHRSEHWIVVEGNPEFSVGENVRTLMPNQSIFAPPGIKHRIANRGEQPVVLIEVQSGDYIDEGDIIRFDDVYNRTTVVES